MKILSYQFFCPLSRTFEEITSNKIIIMTEILDSYFLPDELQYLSDDLKDDNELFLKAVMLDGLAL